MRTWWIRHGICSGCIAMCKMTCKLNHCFEINISWHDLTTTFADSNHWPVANKGALMESIGRLCADVSVRAKRNIFLAFVDFEGGEGVPKVYSRLDPAIQNLKKWLLLRLRRWSIFDSDAMLIFFGITM